MTPSLKSLAPVVLVTALLAGCGGDELSEDEFRSEANAACKKYNDALTKVPGAQNVADIPKVLDATDPLLENLITDLEDIEAPGDQSEDFDRLIDNAKDARKTLAELRAAAQDKDQDELRKVALAAQKRDQAANRVAGDLGLAPCAES